MIFFACTYNVHTYYFLYCWYLFSYPKLNTQSCSKTLIHSVLKNLLRLEGAKSTSLKIAAWVRMYRVQRENSSLHNSSQSKAKNHLRNIGREGGLTGFQKVSGSQSQMYFWEKTNLALRGVERVPFPKRVAPMASSNPFLDWALCGASWDVCRVHSRTSVTRPVSDRTVPLSATPHAKLCGEFRFSDVCSVVPVPLLHSLR